MSTSRTKRAAIQARDVEVPQSRTETRPIRPADTTTPAFLGLIPGAASQPVLVRAVDELDALIGLRVEQNPMRTFLPDAVYSFFANGGAQCYVVACPSMDSTAVLSGLTGLEREPSVSMVAIPDLWRAADPKSVITAVAEHCARLRTRVTIVDLPPDIAPGSALSTLPALSPIQRQFLTVFHPWLRITGTGGERMTPPCGLIMGALARNDKDWGPGRAPTVLAVDDFPLAVGLVDDGEKFRQEEIINILRAQGARKAIVENARTLSSDSDFRHLNVSRLVCFLVDSIQQSMDWVAFEPNTEQLWSTLRASVQTFLSNLWSAGALRGSTPEDAFYVTCDATNNTPSGEAITIDIGVAPTVPAEFVLFTIKETRLGAR